MWWLVQFCEACISNQNIVFKLHIVPNHMFRMSPLWSHVTQLLRVSVIGRKSGCAEAMTWDCRWPSKRARGRSRSPRRYGLNMAASHICFFWTFNLDVMSWRVCKCWCLSFRQGALMELSAVDPWGAPATAATIGSAGPSPPPMVSAPALSVPWGTSSTDPWGVASPTSPTSTDPWGGGAPPPSVAPPPDPWGETANNRVNNVDPWGSSGKWMLQPGRFGGTHSSPPVLKQRVRILDLLLAPLLHSLF